jgi:hypothetical protein
MQVDVQQGRQQPQVGGDRGLEREQAKDPSFDVQVELVHLVVAPDHLATDRRVAARKGLQRLLQQQLGLGAGPLDLALKGAQLLMKAPPDLAHQPNLPCCRPHPLAVHRDGLQRRPDAAHTLAITRPCRGRTTPSVDENTLPGALALFGNSLA